MTVFDYIFLAVLALSAAIGLWRGLVSEVMAMLAWILALMISYLYGHQAIPVFASVIVDPLWRQIAAHVAVFFVVLLIAALIRFLLRELLRAIGLGSVDRFFGACFGLARGLVIALAVVLLGGLTGMSREVWWTQALFAPPLETAVIAAKPWLPDAVADNLRFR